ncbi:MAG: hypothetical protein FRX49_03703 [Trebouxia sp. A1-2]|nr:MAG: hypothetical protein FRX49_03703 [Trebouxia sp. A1-2]
MTCLPATAETAGTLTLMPTVDNVLLPVLDAPSVHQLSLASGDQHDAALVLQGTHEAQIVTLLQHSTRNSTILTGVKKSMEATRVAGTIPGSSLPQGNSIVDSQPPHPHCSGKAGREQHEGEAEDGAHHLHWAVHHQDGQPHRTPGGGLLGWVGHHLPHCLGYPLSHTALLPGLGVYVWQGADQLGTEHDTASDEGPAAYTVGHTSHHLQQQPA